MVKAKEEAKRGAKVSVIGRSFGVGGPWCLFGFGGLLFELQNISTHCKRHLQGWQSSVGGKREGGRAMVQGSAGRALCVHWLHTHARNATMTKGEGARERCGDRVEENTMYICVCVGGGSGLMHSAFAGSRVMCLCLWFRGLHFGVV